MKKKEYHVSYVGDCIPQIDISQIPDYVMDQLCAALYESISIALADPKLRQEYEDWKKGRIDKETSTDLSTAG